MRKLLATVFLSMLSVAANAQQCTEMKFVTPEKIERDQWKTAFDCHQPLAAAGNAYSQTWLGYSYLGGYGVAPSTTTAALWFRKATDNGSPDAPFALAELQYYKLIPSSELDPRDLYILAARRTEEARKKDLPATELRIRINYPVDPFTRLGSVLMRPAMNEADKELVGRYGSRFQKDILSGEKIARDYKITDIKNKLGVANGMNGPEAVRTLACGATAMIEENFISFAGVAAAIESYGVSVEDAFIQTCPARYVRRDGQPRLVAPAAPPLIQSFYAKTGAEGAVRSTDTLSHVNLLMMYMAWSRGDTRGMNKIYKARSADGATLGDLLSSRLMMTANKIAEREVQFRKAYSATPVDVAKEFKLDYVLNNPMIVFPLHVVEAKTANFVNCAKWPLAYSYKQDLASKLKAAEQLPKGPQREMLELSLRDCVEEPDYLSKLVKLEPYFSAYSALGKTKDNAREYSEIAGLSRMLRDICDYEPYHNPTPGYCRIASFQILNRLYYWTDNARSGYQVTSVEEILQTSMR